MPTLATPGAPVRGATAAGQQRAAPAAPTCALRPVDAAAKKPLVRLPRREVLGASLASTAWAAALLSKAEPAQATATFDEATNRLAILEAQMRQLLLEEQKLDAQIQDARAARAVAAAQQAGARSIVPEVLELYPETWEESIGQPFPTFVEFYAPWCPYCKRLDPIWKDLAQQEGSKMQIARLNADTYTDFMPRYNVQGFPTLILFEGGKPTRVYTGRPDLETLAKFVKTYGKA